jgi:DNA replication protein DnaC
MDLVVLDELGYLPFSQAGGALLFHLLSKLYEIKQLIFCKFHEQVLSCCANEPNQGFMVR